MMDDQKSIKGSKARVRGPMSTSHPHIRRPNRWKESSELCQERRKTAKKAARNESEKTAKKERRRKKQCAI